MLEFKLFQPEEPNPAPASRVVLPVSRRLLLKHVKPLLCNAFPFPADARSLLIAQALPGLKRGLLLLQAQRTPALLVCNPGV
jgi:hypothetical protein